MIFGKDAFLSYISVALSESKGYQGPVSCRVTTVARRSSSQLDSHLTTVIRLIGYHERRRRSLDCRNLRHRRATDSRGLPHAWPSPDCASLSFKMAFVMRLQYHAQRQFRRERIFRDRSNPLDIYTDEELFSRFRFPRNELLALIDEFAQELEFPTRRLGSLSAGMQIMIALRFFATGSFQEVIGDVFGVSRMTVHRCIVRVSAVLKRAICQYVHFDNDQQTDQTKRIFFLCCAFSRRYWVHRLHPHKNSGTFSKRRWICEQKGISQYKCSIDMWRRSKSH